MKLYLVYDKTKKTYFRKSYWQDQVPLDEADLWRKKVDASKAIWRKVGRKPDKYALLAGDPDAVKKQAEYDNHKIIEIDITQLIEQELAKP